jgi:EAL domain-containing protein (putative c-di-GMP-specific phosphodiesterase class I)/CHASE2 domain-containing sensor protein
VGAILRLLALCTLTLVAGLAAASGTLRPLEHRLEEATFGILERSASEQVHVVEMDAASMAAIGSWPWPRHHYARLVYQLDAAGVRSISFDVDFSGRSEPKDDRMFAAAIAAAKAPVSLPTFAQHAGFREGRQLDSLPVAPLRDHARLASVSVIADRDGFVRRMPLGTVTAGAARPSLAALIASRSGTAGTSFPINYAINPASIPRHSAIAVERGEVPASSLKGKDVIIGATAIELGDRYPAPRHGVIPGVIVQALATETLLAGVPSYGSWPALLALASVLAAVALRSRRRRTLMLRTGAAAALLVALWLSAQLFAGVWFELVPALMLLGSAGALQYALLTHKAARHNRRIDRESGLFNLIALDGRERDGAERYLIAARIDDFDALKLVIDGKGLGELFRRLADRLAVAASVPTIYRTEDRTLVWGSLLNIGEIEAQLMGLRAMMRSPFELSGHRLGVSLTFGVAPAGSTESAAKAAHAAGQAKRAGRFWKVHDEDAGEAAAQQLVLLGELDEALHRGNITVLYQPKLNLATAQIDAVEALVRWNHPERGLLPPGYFIQLFEEHNRVDELTLAVLAQGLTDMRDWSDRGMVIGIAVNISAALLTSDSFANRALALIARAGVPPHRVTFEVTETAQFEDADKAVAMLARFCACGIRISMDDYGTGQSTLNYLKLLPLAELKIDRMFVQNAHIDRGDAMLVRSTVQLAHELGLTVVAEGIEDAACLDLLTEIGCDYAQGFFIGCPMTARDLVERMGQASPVPARAA